MDVEESAIPFEFPGWKPRRRRFAADSPFFDSGNLERELLSKQVALKLTEEDKDQIRSHRDWANSCPIVGCGTSLKSLMEFEDHYNARHTACCSVCAQVYPTTRLLSIHLSEAHDSFFQAKVARGLAMFECLVEGCGAKLKSYKSRQQHLIDKHKFPTSFEFLKKANHPSKKHRHKIKRNERDAIESSPPASSAQPDEKENVDDLVSAVSKLTTSDAATPSSISFGRRGRGRGIAPLVPRAVLERRSKGGGDHLET
ncbi:hypothetical protein M569_03097 [Genlisea aurea]|uniref:C2H2-type domain-containing protein n=1 Tax=Genlisea aurea TaxID=192259 RepID=S8E741_9LAMI|nr:hypothetical protein M569_03097 [Genlisea aurea]